VPEVAVKRAASVLATLALSVTLAASCGGGSTGGGSFKWYGSNPPVVGNSCEYLGKASDGVEVWQCTPL
jgi:hypothetical protein